MRGWVAVALLLGGCIAEQPWTTARTLPAGEVQHTVAVEGVAKLRDPYTLCGPAGVEDGDLFCEEHGFVSPAYTVRAGLEDRVELAGHFSLLGGVGAELKTHVVDAPVLDIGVGFAALLSPAGANGSLRALVSLNLSDAWTVTFMPRAGYRLMPSWAENPAHEDEGSAAFAGAGMALHVLVRDGFRVGLGVSWARSLGGRDEGADYLAFGPALSFGAHSGR